MSARHFSPARRHLMPPSPQTLHLPQGLIAHPSRYSQCHNHKQQSNNIVPAARIPTLAAEKLSVPVSTGTRTQSRRRARRQFRFTTFARTRLDPHRKQRQLRTFQTANSTARQIVAPRAISTSSPSSTKHRPSTSRKKSPIAAPLPPVPATQESMAPPTATVASNTSTSHPT